MENFLKIKPGFDFCFQEEYERFFIEHKAMMIENYNDHILRVTRSVPASRLLVWNVKGKKTPEIFFKKLKMAGNPSLNF